MATARQTGYDDANRAFLQAFMARSTLTFEEAQEILAAILSAKQNETISPEDITRDDLSNFINATNSAISPFDLEIRSHLPQLTLDDPIHNPPPDTQAQERIWALVNTTSDNLTQLATTFTADEISFVKRVLDRMFDGNKNRIAEVMAVSSIEAVQQAKVSGEGRRESGMGTQTQGQGQTQRTTQPLSMTQAEVVLKQLVEDGWFEKSRKGYYSLSPRGLMELRGWLVATYNDEEGGVRKIKFCAACRELITVGQRCGNRDCGGRLHDHCMRNFFRVQKAEQCPVCKAPWPGDRFVGERAVVQGGQRRGGNVRRSGVAPATQGTVNGEEDGEDAEDAEDSD
ncbi:Nse1 non-SMC component of SMC5-6 complex-domain-containing protein [Aspergillus karnatakaensis]|uniref:Nse1 non-SMC component of SMC5-6 complex-domain-containing protein n=1 Tax=Aspergillus karnatakaensis TaxID=1810916 RepID=UPI003CCD2A67